MAAANAPFVWIVNSCKSVPNAMNWYAKIALQRGKAGGELATASVKGTFVKIAI